MSRGPYKKGV